MAKNIHTKKQEEAINRAWVHLLYWAERKQGLKQELEEAMRRDKNQRSTFPTTRALIMRELLYIVKHNPKVSDERYTYTEEALLIGGILGYRAYLRCRDYGTGKQLQELMLLMEHAVKEHQLAIEARMHTH